jgi:putative tryptophan/tyrosine transport system substrate-binding protein
MKRRAFVTLLGGAAVAWLAAARAQQPERMRKVGVLMNSSADDPNGQRRLATFLQKLQQLGWSDGRNVRIETRWAGAEVERGREYAAELIRLAPDVILASNAPSVSALQQGTRTLPIVFVAVADPVGSGLVASLGRPGGNVTGFTLFEYAISVKWLEMLKEMAPRLTRVAVLRDPTIATGIGQFGAIQSVAPSHGVELRPVDLRDPREIESTLTAFAREPNGGVIVSANPLATRHRTLIITLVARLQVPAVYAFRFFVDDGGLISYGPDIINEYRRAAEYVDRILRGEKPSDLPVQAPTKYELVINLKTAKALGLEISPTLLTRADEVIE